MSKHANPDQEVIELTFARSSKIGHLYIPAFSDGGLFAPTAEVFELGQAVTLIIHLTEDDKTYCCDAVVAWITPEAAQHGRIQGVGLAFIGEEGKRCNAALEPCARATPRNVRMRYSLA